MEWVQFIIFFIGVFGLFIWNRAEARSDARHMDAKLESQRNFTDAKLESQRNLINAIHEEMRDFHTRLCIIEERNRGK
jgi:hypothetical protein